MIPRRFLSVQESKDLDAFLISPAVGFEMPQLIEQAGIAAAQAIADHYSLDSHPRVLALCGPGNNGADGLVAARYLSLGGYSVGVCCPKSAKIEGFLRQALQFGCRQADTSWSNDDYDLVIDSIFGFSFRPPFRPPFDTLIGQLAPTRVPIVSIDVPSGCDPDTETLAAGFTPDLLLHMSAPKRCCQHYRGQQVVCCHFVPAAACEKFWLDRFCLEPGKLYAYAGPAHQTVLC